MNNECDKVQKKVEGTQLHPQQVKQQVETQDSCVRKRQHLLIYIIMMIISSLNCLHFSQALDNSQISKMAQSNSQSSRLLEQQPRGIESASYRTIITFSSFVYIPISCIFFIAHSYYLQKKWKGILQDYFMLDNMLITGAFACLIFGVAAYLKNMALDQNALILLILFTTYSITFLGNFRVVMKRVLWNRWQIILFKLIIGFQALLFIFIALSLLISSKASSADIYRGAAIDIRIVEALTLFAFYFEIYSKISDIDGTGSFRKDYVLATKLENRQQLIQQRRKIDI